MEEMVKRVTGMKVLILVTLAVMICMAGIAYAADSKQSAESAVIHQHHDNDGCTAGHAAYEPTANTPSYSLDLNKAAMITTVMPVLYAQNIPEPQCVCAGCNRKCGSGHTSSCPYRPKK
jgi:hypothetical protein